jgi:HEAT repeat protein
MAALLGTFLVVVPSQAAEGEDRADEALLHDRYPGGLRSLYPEDEDRADEALLREARVSTDGPGLLAFFRDRSLGEADRQRLADLVRQLGSDDFDQREKASTALIARGPLAIPFLRQAIASTDTEVARRARFALEEIDHGPGPALPAAAARLLVRRKPAGAVEALLRYAPHADDLGVQDEVAAAVTALGLHEGKAGPALLAALQDRDPARRAAAVAAVGRSTDPGQRAAARRLLEDPEPAVRYRAALAALAGRDRAGLPALVRLLNDAPPELAGRAEEMLFRLAGDQAPQTATTGEKREAAWQRWLRERGDRADLARLDSLPPYLGFTLVVEPNANTVWECDHAGRVRWQINGLSRPHDAQLLANGHVLVCEHGASRVTERDSRGAILWSHAVQDPRYVERLANGNTFIATPRQAFEATPAGEEISKIFFEGGTHLGIHRRPNGHVVILSIPGHLQEMNGGRTVRSFDLPRGHWCGVHALPNNHYLAAELNEGRVVEVDAAGKVVWECRVAQACQALRRPDGRTLVCSYGGRRIVELDRAGKIVWERACDTNVWRARSR